MNNCSIKMSGACNHTIFFFFTLIYKILIEYYSKHASAYTFVYLKNSRKSKN